MSSNPKGGLWSLKWVFYKHDTMIVLCRSMSRTSQPGLSQEPVPDLKQIYCNVWGSSFTKIKPWGLEIVPEQQHLQFTMPQLQKLFDTVSCVVKFIIQ